MLQVELLELLNIDKLAYHKQYFSTAILKMDLRVYFDCVALKVELATFYYEHYKLAKAYIFWWYTWDVFPKICKLILLLLSTIPSTTVLVEE